ncbi:MAG: hypothetical protein IPH49_05750 [Ignavibacteria bacterium]|nr:hypothetical protein [Ignavibacteria bacterium]
MMLLVSMECAVLVGTNPSIPHDTNVVCRIELPYVKGNDSTGLITFTAIPDEDSIVKMKKDSFNNDMGLATTLRYDINGQFVDNASGAKEFVVRRWMLKKHFYSGYPTVTISAGFRCDFTKDLIKDTLTWKTEAINNPRLSFTTGGYRRRVLQFMTMTHRESRNLAYASFTTPIQTVVKGSGSTASGSKRRSHKSCFGGSLTRRLETR